MEMLRFFQNLYPCFIPENKEGFIEFEFSSSGYTGKYLAGASLPTMLMLVPSGSNYLDPALTWTMDNFTTSASFGLFLGTHDGAPWVGAGNFALNAYAPWYTDIFAPGVPLLVEPPGQNNAPSFNLERSWRIGRRRLDVGPGDTKAWYIEWHQKPHGSDCWSTFARKSTTNTSSLYGVVDFGNGSVYDQLTSSCKFPNVEVYHTHSWRRSNYTHAPTASVTYCYPAGFITNDTNRVFPADPSSRYGTNAYTYKDYGLMWNVSAERKRVLGEARSPAFNSYKDYSLDIRFIGKNYSIIPEFVISKQVPQLVDAGMIITDFGFLDLDGASITSSGEGVYSG